MTGAEEDFLHPLDALERLVEARQMKQNEKADTSTESIPRNSQDWDQIFAESGEDFFFGREPSSQARTAWGYWKTLGRKGGGSLLDLGCGEGRDAVFFAQKGFDVIAVDGSAVGLDKLARLAEEARVGMTRVYTDLRHYRLPYPISFLHANNSLQFLGDECLPYLRYLQENAPSESLHSVSIMTTTCVPEQEGLYRFEPGELEACYAGWRLLYYGEEKLWREPAGRYLSFARILAVAP